MLQNLIIFIIALFAFPTQMTAQKDIESAGLETIKSYEDTVALLSYAIIHDSLPEHRFAACRKLIPTLVNALKVDNSFQYKFPKLQSISIQYPKDSTFRIFTWQLFVDDNDYRYYGAIQMNNKELKLFPLVDRSFEVRDLERDVLTPQSWYGALCYNVMQYDSRNGRKYLLFGFDGFSFFERRKLIDVLTFEGGEPIFGKEPGFKKLDQASGEEIPVNRLHLDYSASAAVRLNFDESLGHIMHDHLILMGSGPGGGPTYVPDGSYQGYMLQEGMWVNIPKVYTQIQEEAPRDFPILDSGNPKKERKNIFGKPGKPKGR